MTIPKQAVERDAEELLARAQYFVDCKYVARSDARQREMGLAYVEAERADLARQIASFTTNELKRVKPLMGVQRPEDVVRALEEIKARAILARTSAPDERFAQLIAIEDKARAALALPHTGQPQEGAAMPTTGQVITVLREYFAADRMIFGEAARAVQSLFYASPPPPVAESDQDHERDSQVVKPIGQERP